MEDSVCYKVNGYKTPLEYRKGVSSCYHISGIRIPTLFYFALDDPLIQTNSIDFKSIKENPYVSLATTKYGSHLCCFDNYFKNRQWITRIGVDFLKTARMIIGDSGRKNTSRNSSINYSSRTLAETDDE